MCVKDLSILASMPPKSDWPKEEKLKYFAGS